MPFRSETEPLREQIRRVEEEASELVDERRRLEQQLAEQERAGRGRRRMLLFVAALLSVLATAFVGFTAGDLAAERRARHEGERRARRDAEALGEIGQAARECGQLEVAKKSELSVCDRERESARWHATLPRVPRPPRSDARPTR